MKSRSHASPPKWALKFLRWYCKTELLDEIEGDLMEAFLDRKENSGIRSARFWYAKEVVKFFRPFAIRRWSKGLQIQHDIDMIQNYLLTTLRSALKNKAYMSLNLLGLALGMAACLLILQYIDFEHSYNEFHEKGDEIYRISYSKENNGVESFHTVLTYAGVGKLMQEQFPEVINFTRLRPAGLINSRTLIKYGDRSFEESDIYYADASFFDLFSFKLIKGNPTQVLKEQFSVVITESMAQKYFGNENPIGKNLRKGSNEDFVVTGIMEDTPPNSHMQIQMLLSHSTLAATQPEWWDDDNLGVFHGHLYVLVKSGTNVDQFTAKFPQFVTDFIWGEEMQKTNAILKLWAMPLKDIHLHSHIEHEAEMNGDVDIVNYLSLIAILILVIALVNYINLSTARAMERAREVGIRKVAGAFKLQLIGQFLLESFLINLVAILIAVGIVLVSQPLFAELGAAKLQEVNLWTSQIFWFSCLGILIISTVLAGVYPAWVLSQFKPVTVLKGSISRQGKGAIIRKSLVVFQFTASIALIITTITVYQQISFMRNQQLGIDIDQTLVVKAPLVADSTYESSLTAFKNAILQNPEIEGFTACHTIPGREYQSATWFVRKDNPEVDNQFCYINWVDEHFMDNFQVKMLAGRNFQPDNEADQRAVIINEILLKQFQFSSAEEAIGKALSIGDSRNENPPLRIIGVISNFHQQTLKLDYSPVIIRYFPYIRGYFALKLNFPESSLAQVDASIDKVSDLWSAHFASQPFNYFFLKESFNHQYQAEITFGKLISLFSLIALIVGCLGLLGLATFMTRLRTREIGIRKVLGSGVIRIMGLLVGDFLILFAISSVIAWILSWWALNSWLETFAFHIDLNWIWFVGAAVVVALIALASISYHVLKAAYSNPVYALRHE